MTGSPPASCRRFVHPRAPGNRLIVPRSPREGNPSPSFDLVLYTDANLVGGAERVLMELVRWLDPGIDTTIMGTDEQVVDWVARHRKGATTCVVPPVRSKRDLGSIAAHWRAVRSLRPAIFQANLRTPWSCQYGIATALMVSGTKVVAVEHLPTPPVGRTQRVLKRMTSRRLQAQVAVGNRSARELEDLIGLTQGSIRTIHNGVQCSSTASSSRPFVGPTVAAVGRLTRQKGFDVLLKALARTPDVAAVIVGDGPELGRLERLRDELGLHDRVRFTGWVPDSAAVLHFVDALVLSSRNEAFPLVILEAMFAGLPVVATDVGSVREAVVSNTTGLVVPPDDVDALADAIRRVLDPTTAARMGQRARTIAVSSFGAERMARDYESLYLSLLS